ncbi:hypothetical protein BJY04DRAFT_200433 [Aspergillus karnatakaensis]|uniref:uncharacterized protein n=1 Tax=Aspergillus karnatakaensis TaxID=1810916 RepID=UPI003CCDE7DD
MPLNTISGAFSANSRFLMQFVPTTPSLNPTLPSLGNALAVLSGSTLIMSSVNAPFVPYGIVWKFSDISESQSLNLSTQQSAELATSLVVLSNGKPCSTPFSSRRSQSVRSVLP